LVKVLAEVGKRFRLLPRPPKVNSLGNIAVNHDDPQAVEPLSVKAQHPINRPYACLHLRRKRKKGVDLGRGNKITRKWEKTRPEGGPTDTQSLG